LPGVSNDDFRAYLNSPWSTGSERKLAEVVEQTRDAQADQTIEPEYKALICCFASRSCCRYLFPLGDGSRASCRERGLRRTARAIKHLAYAGCVVLHPADGGTRRIR
jgi:hypothetical protein